MKCTALCAALSLAATIATAGPWTTHGPRDGTILHVAIAAANHEVVYVHAPDGIFRTRNGGASWTNVTGPLVTPTGVVVDDVSPDVVIASASNGVFRSPDGGTSWIVASGVPPDWNIASLVVDPRDSNVIYAVAGRCRGVLKSSDGARSFTVLTTDSRGTNEFCEEILIVDPVEPQRLYRPWVYSDVWGNDRSENGGSSWTPLSFADAPRRGSIAAAGTLRYAIGGTTYPILLTSTDGVTWSEVSYAGIPYPLPYALQLLDLAADPASGRLFLATNNGAYRSDDGRTWVVLEGTLGETVHTIRYDAGALVISTDFGILRSNSFPWNTWTDLHVGNSAMPMLTIVRDPANGDVYAQSGLHLFRGTNLGTSWQPIGDPIPGGYALTVDAGHDVYTSYTDREGYAQVYKLAADGHWRVILTTAGSPRMTADPLVPGTLYLSGGNVIKRTRDGGTTWDALAPPVANASLTSLAIDPHDSKRLIASTSSAVILKSVDGGATWLSAPQTMLKYLYSMEIAPSDPNVIYGIGPIDQQSSHYVLARSGDGGTTFFPQPAPSDTIFAFAIDPHDADRVFILTPNDVVLTNDGGRNWQSVGAGLPAGELYAMTIDSAGAYVHVATGSSGVWELPLVPRRHAVPRR